MCLGRRRPRSAASTRGLSTYVYVRGIGEGEYEREQLFSVIFAFELNCVRELLLRLMHAIMLRWQEKQVRLAHLPKYLLFLLLFSRPISYRFKNSGSIRLWNLC